jgi:hypothetical protein
MTIPLALTLAMPLSLNLHSSALSSDLALILHGSWPGYRSYPTMALALILL